MKITERQLKRIIKESLQLEMFDTGSAGDEVGGTSLAQKKEQCELVGGKWVSDDPSGEYGRCSEPIKETDTEPAPYEDNQTKMVRKYLTLRGEEASLSSMSQEEIEDKAAMLRSLPPSTKKRWGIYDLREARTKITRRQLRQIIKELAAPGSLERSMNKRPWSGGPNEIMTISSSDVAWESHALGNKTHRRGDVFVDSLPAGVTIKDASDEYTLTKGPVVSTDWQSFEGQDKDGVKVTVTPRTDW